MLKKSTSTASVNKSELCFDGSIICKAIKIPVRKALLAANSKYFLESFKFTDVVDLSSVVDFPILQCLLQFVETGCARFPVEREAEFFVCAKKLRIEGLSTGDYSVEIIDEQPAKRTKIVRTPIQDFPPEILIKILGYVADKDLIRNVSCVSKAMYELTKDKTFGISAKFDRKMNLQKAQNLMRTRSHQLQEITLRIGVTCKTFAFLTNEISALTNLRKLDISTDFTLTKQFTTQLFQIESLTDLTLNATLEDSSMSGISDCKRLKHLRLFRKVSETELLVVAGIASLATLHLDDLELINFQKYEESFQALTSNCSATFPYGHLFPVTESSIETMFNTFPNIKILKLWGRCFIRLDCREKVSAFHSTVARCKNLKELEIPCFVFDVAVFRAKFADWKVKYSDSELKLKKS